MVGSAGGPAAADLKDSRLTQMATWQGHILSRYVEVVIARLEKCGQTSWSVTTISRPGAQLMKHCWLRCRRSSRLRQGRQRITGYNQFWLQPSTGELLAETDLGTLWSSSDVGKHWTQRVVPLSVVPPDAIPANATTSEQQGGPYIAASRHFLVQPSAVDQTFEICGEIDVRHAQEQVPGPMVAFACSWDGGQTWIARPQLQFAPLCRLCDRQSPPNQNLSVYAVTPDGSLLAQATPRGMDGADAFCLLPRAATQASQWEYLGPVCSACPGWRLLSVRAELRWAERRDLGRVHPFLHLGDKLSMSMKPPVDHCSR